MKEIEWSEESVDDRAALSMYQQHAAPKLLWNALPTGVLAVPKGSKALTPPEFRLRVGDFRVRFQSNGDILRVRNRKEAYR